MSGFGESKARVYWELMNRFKDRKVVTEDDVPEIAQTIAESLEGLSKERSQEPHERPEKLLIVDGMNTFIRNFVVVPTMDSNGDDAGGIIGMLRSLKKLVSETKATRAIIVWDGEGGSAKRRGVFKEYKMGRKPRMNRTYDFDSPEESLKNMQTQIERTKNYIDSLGVKQVCVDEIEADDVIAFLSTQIYPSIEKIIMSTDRDFLQLVNEQTTVYSPSKKLYYRSAEVKEQFEVLAENFVYLKAFTGDRTDNIDGIKGIGPKTLVKLFPFLAERASSLEEIFLYCESGSKKNPKYNSILEQKDLIYRNVGLMQLSTPTIGSTAIRQIKHALEKETIEPVMSEFKLKLLRDGLTIVDGDFFSTFREYHVRAKNNEKEKEETE